MPRSRADKPSSSRAVDEAKDSSSELPQTPSFVSLGDWSTHALARDGVRPAPHHLRMIEHLSAIARGDIDRLMLLLPPGHAKSTYATVLFPAWFLAREPRSSVISACHTADLAEHFARRVREMVLLHGDVLGLGLKRDDRAAARWRTLQGGDYFACGIRGPITGRRADLVLIDDPIKSHAEADSPSARNALWNWYRSDLATRLKPRGRIVLTMTRWHQDDLGGRLIDADPSWTVLRLPALAEPNDPLGRAPGAALWPEWEDEAALARKRRTVGARVWNALFQQNPVPDTEALFATTRVRIIDALPPIKREIRAWDLAATAATQGSNPDWTVGLKLALTEDGQHIVTDVVRFRAGPSEVADTIRAVASQDGQGVLVALPQDPGQAGKQQVAWLSHRLVGHRVRASPETGSKLTRATLPAASVEAGTFSLLRAAWNRDFLDELRDFPHGRKDDQVDALSRAFALLSASSGPTTRLHLPHLAR
jgi:predicted phage terminase large subunit-like protein